MNNGLRLFLISLLALSFTACSSISSKQNEAISKAVYGERAALKSGRYDLAEKFNEQATRLIPPPKKAIAVKPVSIKGVQTVILPRQFQSSPAVAVDSPAFNLAVASNKTLQSQLKAENKAIGSLTNQTDNVIRAKSVEAAKFEAERPSIWHRILSVFKWLWIPLGIAGVIALCLFCPAVIPFVLSAVSLIGKFISWILSACTQLINRLKK